MFRKGVLSTIVWAAFSLTFIVLGIRAQTGVPFVTGLRAPQKIIYAQHQRYFLVSESGISGLPNS
ncbi:MAG: hypothetical protein H7070_04155, partial [Saprospiraceae bacterium]|nr:hypothetical protein [Pyrinomonadaceae bacterium]